MVCSPQLSQGRTFVSSLLFPQFPGPSLARVRVWRGEPVWMAVLSAPSCRCWRRGSDWSSSLRERPAHRHSPLGQTPPDTGPGNGCCHSHQELPNMEKANMGLWFWELEFSLSVSGIPLQLPGVSETL